MYVVFEGIEGSGKDTQANMLADAWAASGAIPLRVNEPDDQNPIGKLLRQFLAAGTSPKTHAALFLADRMALHHERILPAIEAGKSVISSRSFLSTLVYQQEQWPLDWLFDLHRTLPTQVDAFIILDVDPEEGLGRVDSRGYRREYLADGGKVFVVNTTGKTAQEVHREVRMCLEDLMGPTT